MRPLIRGETENDQAYNKAKNREPGETPRARVRGELKLNGSIGWQGSPCKMESTFYLTLLTLLELTDYDEARKKGKQMPALSPFSKVIAHA